MLLLHLYKTFFCFYCFPNIIKYVLNIAITTEKMTVNELRDFIFENYKRIGFVKESSYYSMKCLKRKDLLLLETKLIEKIPDTRIVKEHYQSFIRKKNTKPVKQANIFETPNIVDIKSVIVEHPRTSHKSSKTTRQTEKVSLVDSGKSSNSSLYSDTKISKNFLKEKNVKITKRAYAFKGYVNSYNVEILNYFNPELQLKDTESSIKSKLIDLMTQLKGFKFVTTLVF